MNITTSTYPQIKLIQTNTNEGIFNKMALIKNSFLSKKKNSMFLPLKNNIKVAMPTPIKAKKNGYLTEMLFHGFNFNIKRVNVNRKPAILNTHKSVEHLIHFTNYADFTSKIFKKRILMFSYNNSLLYDLQQKISDAKRPNSYTGKGLFERNDTYNIKKRRKRK